MNAPHPRVLVLLATYNGERWLDEQLASLFAQQGVDIAVVASDDRSVDGSLAVLHRWAAERELHCLAPPLTRLGSANRNFLRLIRDADPETFTHVALADQDDIWSADKCLRAVTTIAERGADAYSSDVVAFWPDGRHKRLRKSQPPRTYDHLFESAGPGCTFVFRREAFVRLQRWVAANFERLQAVKVHDWLIYAFARTNQWTWFIDTQTNVMYRQHGGNEIGANAGPRAVVRRIRAVLSGAFRHDVLAIAAAVDDRSWVAAALRRFAPLDRIRLALHFRQLRRRLRDQALLAVLLLVMRRT